MFGLATYYQIINYSINVKFNYYKYNNYSNNNNNNNNKNSL